MELFVNGVMLGKFNSLNECYQKFDNVRAADWIIIENGYVMDKKN